MSRTLLYLITHAHTQADPATDAAHWCLSAQGERQAALLVLQPFWTQVDRIVLSSEPKTRLTVAPLLVDRPLPVTVDARFDELLRPGWVEEYERRVAQALANPARPAGDWEPANHGLHRFLAGVADLCTQWPGQTLALVGHGLTLSLYRAHLLGQSHVVLADWQRLSFAAVALVDPVNERLLQDFEPVAGAAPRGRTRPGAG
jgi:broad specificity phosphatase PhoE